MSPTSGTPTRRSPPPPQRRFHPPPGAAALRLRPAPLPEVLRQGGHLPRGIRRMVLHPLRVLLDRAAAVRGKLPRVPPPRRKAEGAFLLLPAVEVSEGAPRLLCGGSE